jgi:3'(2'), 5'-bisphosphate nucleotidase
VLENIDLEKIVQIGRKAGEAILEVYKKDFDVEFKADQSPLTQADKKANEIICNGLKELYPEIPILSEENKQIPYSERKDWQCYWCVDPLDGTKEFVKRNGEFTVNIALICDRVPVLGVVYAPVIDKMYKAAQGRGAYVNNKKLPLKTSDVFSVVASKSHNTPETRAFIEKLRQQYQNIKLVSRGSSLKLCMVAEGSAKVYPRIAPTMEWDTAAAHAIVLETGHKVWQYNPQIKPEDYLNQKSQQLKPLIYNKPELLNPFFVVA